MFLLCASMVLFDDCSFVVLPEVREPDSSSSILLSQKIVLAIQELLCFHTNFIIICSSSMKNAICI